MKTFELLKEDEQDDFWLGLGEAVRAWVFRNSFRPMFSTSVEDIANELKSEWISTLDDAIGYFQQKYKGGT